MTETIAQRIRAHKGTVMGFLQKLGKSMLLPVACMPLCGILMGIGYWLCPSTMQGGEAVGTLAVVGTFLVKAGGALLDNAPLLFVIGVGVGMSEKNDGVGALAALTSWLIFNALLSPDFVSVIAPRIADDPIRMLAFGKINNPFIGILSGVIGSSCYNRFKDTKLPIWLTFFSGKRSVAIISGFISVLVSCVLFFVWPLLFTGLVRLGKGISGLGIVGAGLYAMLNRLLIPSGLHHALNNVFWFDLIGLGDLTNFWAGKTSADVGWSLGMYMTGFFPCMMFGIGGGALAMILSSQKKDRKRVFGILIGSVVCAFTCGITEPFEFAFMFICPLLYFAYSLLYGVITVIALSSGFRAGFSCSGGVIDLIFSTSLPASQKTWMIFPLGLLSFVLFFLVFTLILRFKHIDLFAFSNESADHPRKVSSSYREMAANLLTALGGRDNIRSLDNCITRLRLELKNSERLDKKAVLSSGALEVLRFGQNSFQVVIGTEVQFVADAMKALLEEEPDGTYLTSPTNGRFLPMAEIPDPVFAEGVLGPCCGIDPVSGELTAPADGEVIQIAETGHSVCLLCGKYEVLIHAGVDTVKLKGKGFTCHVQNGDRVKAGTPLLTMDIPVIREAGLSPVIILAVTNGGEENCCEFIAREEMCSGDRLLRITETEKQSLIDKR